MAPGYREKSAKGTDVWAQQQSQVQPSEGPLGIEPCKMGFPGWFMSAPTARLEPKNLPWELVTQVLLASLAPNSSITALR